MRLERCVVSVVCYSACHGSDLRALWMQTLLMEAACAGHAVVCDLLLEAKADVNAKDKRKQVLSLSLSLMPWHSRSLCRPRFCLRHAMGSGQRCVCCCNEAPTTACEMPMDRFAPKAAIAFPRRVFSLLLSACRLHWLRPASPTAWRASRGCCGRERPPTTPWAVARRWLTRSLRTQHLHFIFFFFFLRNVFVWPVRTARLRSVVPSSDSSYSRR